MNSVEDISSLTPSQNECSVVTDNSNKISSCEVEAERLDKLTVVDLSLYSDDDLNDENFYQNGEVTTGFLSSISTDEEEDEEQSQQEVSSTSKSKRKKYSDPNERETIKLSEIDGRKKESSDNEKRQAVTSAEPPQEEAKSPTPDPDDDDYASEEYDHFEVYKPEPPESNSVYDSLFGADDTLSISSEGSVDCLPVLLDPDALLEEDLYVEEENLTGERKRNSKYNDEYFKNLDKKLKSSPPQTKVYFRRLPSQIQTIDDLEDIISNLPAYDYIRFKPPEEPIGRGVLFINFLKHEDAVTFIRRYNNYIFIDDKGTEAIGLCGFAFFPWTGQGLVDDDPLEGTLSDDEEYIKFKKEYEETDYRDFVAGVPVNPDGEPLTPEQLLIYVEEKHRRLECDDKISPLVKHLKKKLEKKKAKKEEAKKLLKELERATKEKEWKDKCARKKLEKEKKRKEAEEKRKANKKEKQERKEKERKEKERQKKEKEAGSKEGKNHAEESSNPAAESLVANKGKKRREKLKTSEKESESVSGSGTKKYYEDKNKMKEKESKEEGKNDKSLKEKDQVSANGKRNSSKITRDKDKESNSKMGSSKFNNSTGNSKRYSLSRNRDLKEKNEGTKQDSMKSKDEESSREVQKPLKSEGCTEDKKLESSNVTGDKDKEVSKERKKKIVKKIVKVKRSKDKIVSVEEIRKIECSESGAELLKSEVKTTSVSSSSSSVKKDTANESKSGEEGEKKKKARPDLQLYRPGSLRSARANGETSSLRKTSGTDKGRRGIDSKENIKLEKKSTVRNAEDK